MKTPRLALGSWAFSFGPFERAPWSFRQVLEYASAAGYDGVEINGFRPHPHPDDYDTPAKCRALMAEISDLGLGVSGYAPAFGEVPPAEVEADAYLAVLRKSLDFCVNCGIRTLRVDAVSPPAELPPAEYEARFARLTSTWRKAAREASRAGILVAWEFEPGFWLNKPSEVAKMVDAVGEPGFRLLFDTSHAYMGAVVGARHTGAKETLRGGVVEYATMLGERIGHLHLIDSDGTLHGDETSTHTAFGAGYVDFPAVLGALKPVAERLPWWCVDFCFNPETPTAAREAVSTVRRLMREAL